MVEAGEVRLACRVSGDPGGGAVVLLHALGKNGSDWEETAEALGRRWRVYVPDLRGHGRSDWPGEYSFELMRDDLAALLTALRLSKVTLVGHSLGGVVAYLYAAQHPERVERLVLEDAPPPFAHQRPMPERPPGELDFDWEAVAPLHAQLAAPTPEWAAGLDAIGAPTLVLSGGMRSRVPREQVAAMAGRFSNRRLVTIPCGHGIHSALPTEYAAALHGFLPGGING